MMAVADLVSSGGARPLHFLQYACRPTSEQKQGRLVTSREEDDEDGRCGRMPRKVRDAIRFIKSKRCPYRGAISALGHDRMQFTPHTIAKRCDGDGKVRPVSVPSPWLSSEMPPAFQMASSSSLSTVRALGCTCSLERKKM